MGTKAENPLQVATTNEPEIGFDFSIIALGLKILDSLKKADNSPGFRPLYPISELGLKDKSLAKTPRWMMLRPRFSGKTLGLDFRDDLDLRLHPRGIVIDIFVSDKTKNTAEAKAWTRIGEILLKESVVSYACDRQLHFAHPKLR